MKKYMLFISFIFTISLTLLSMQNESEIQEAIDFLRTQEIIATAQLNNYNPHSLSGDIKWSSRKHNNGYFDCVPQLLINPNTKKCIFSGKKLSTKKNTSNHPNYFQKSPNNLYKAEITTTTDAHDTVILTTKDPQNKKTISSSFPLFSIRSFTTNLCFNPQSTHLIVGGTGKYYTLTAWNLETKKEEQILDEHIGYVSAIQFNHTGTKMLTVSYINNQATIVLWDTHDINNITLINKTIFTSKAIFNITFSPLEDRAVLSACNGDIIFLDGNTGEIINKKSLSPHDTTENITTYTIFTPDNTFCITTTSFGENTSNCSLLWNACNGEKLATLLSEQGHSTGIGLTPDNRSVVTILQKSAFITDLFTNDSEKYLDYLSNQATATEKTALHHLYCAYKNNTPSTHILPSILNDLPKNPFIRNFIKKHLLVTHNNNTHIQLNDNSNHTLEPHELETSIVLLQKKLLRKKTTPNVITKWGYDPNLHEQFQQMPLYLDINTDLFNLFKNFLFLSTTQFKKDFALLSPTEQNNLFFIASNKGLNVPHLLAQLYEATLLPETTIKHLLPHFSLKNVISHLHHAIITYNAQNNLFIQKPERLRNQEQWLMHYDPLLKIHTLIPKKVIKNTLFCFKGAIKNVMISLENQCWKRITQKTIYKDENKKNTYYITPCVTYEESFPLEKHKKKHSELLLWITDSTFNVLNKKTLSFGGNFSHVIFSPNGHFLASTLFATPEHPYNTVAITTINTETNSSYLSDIILPHITQKITALCFDETSTLLAIGSKPSPNEHKNNLSIRNVSTGKELFSLATPENENISYISFNHKGTRLLSISNNKNSQSSFYLWDISDYSNIKQISTILIYNNLMHFPCFSSDDEIISAILSDRNLIFINGVTGDIISYKEKDTLQSNKSTFGTFSHDNTLLASLSISNKKSKGFLWDTHTGTKLIKLTPQNPQYGIGFTPDKRHIITSRHQFCSNESENKYYTTTTTLFDKNTHKALKWIKHNTSLAQKHALLTAFALKQHNSFSAENKKLLLHIMHNEDTKNPCEIAANEIIRQHL